MKNTYCLSTNLLNMSLNDLLIVLLVVFFSVPLKAQQLPTPIQYISQENNSFIFLRNGETLEGIITETQTLEGYFNGLEIITKDGEVHDLLAIEVKCMYLPTMNSNLPIGPVNSHHWDPEYKEYMIDKNFIDNGYAFLESIEAEILDKEVMVFMQLLNPATEWGIKIYEDPLINIPLSIIKTSRAMRNNTDSYYVKKGNTSPQLIEISEYETQFHDLWGACYLVVENYPTIIWQDLLKHMEDFANCAQ